LHLAGQADEVLVMGGSEALGVRALQAQPGLALHLVYDPSLTSWTQLRPRLMAMDAALPRAPVL
jgi:predicted membrane-bound spermidine synthase